MVSLFSKIGSGLSKVSKKAYSYSKEELKKGKKVGSEKYKKYSDERKRKQVIRNSKLKLLNSLTLYKLKELTKAFLTEDPKVKYYDEQGKKHIRKPTRKEYIEALNKTITLRSLESYLERKKGTKSKNKKTNKVKSKKKK